MSDKYNTGPDDIVKKIADLEARLSTLERVPSLSSASIDSGGLTVKGGNIRVTDPNGVVQVILGLQSDGSYGLGVLEAGVGFHQIPYVYTSFISTGETCSSSTYGDLATIGPTVNVPVRGSGRILIIASAQVQWTASAGLNTLHDGRFDVAFSGANSRTPNEAVDPLVGLIDAQLVTSTNNQLVMIISLTTQATFESLTPGSTTITMKYRRVGGVTDDPQFFRRGLTVVAL